MDKKQYNNVIDWTLKHEQSAQTEDSLATARAIFNNMGVALPSGDIKEVCEILKTNNYMGWHSCTMQEAQQAANGGTAAIGISDDRIVVISAADKEEPVAQTASVMTLSENTSAYAVDGMSYYSYRYGGTGQGGGNSQNGLYFETKKLTVDVGWSGYNSVSGPGHNSVNWTSSNPDIASVGYYSGFIKTHKCGTVQIHVNSASGVRRATFELVVEPRICREEKSDGFIWQISGGGIASFFIKLSLSCKITEWYEDRVKIESVSAFIHTNKNPFALASPELTIGVTTINGESINMRHPQDLWVSPDWIWGSGYSPCNIIVPKGTVIKSIGLAMMKDAVLGYRDINIELTI